jgi:hypothetical protein
MTAPVDLTRRLRGQPASDVAELAACEVFVLATLKDVAATGSIRAVARLHALMRHKIELADRVRGAEQAN